jgi:hypothetical protein
MQDCGAYDEWLLAVSRQPRRGHGRLDQCRTAMLFLLGVLTIAAEILQRGFGSAISPGQKEKTLARGSEGL